MALWSGYIIARSPRGIACTEERRVVPAQLDVLTLKRGSTILGGWSARKKMAQLCLWNNDMECDGKSELTYVTVIPLTLMLLQRPSGEQDRLATTAFSFPDDVPDILPDMSS